MGVDMIISLIIGIFLIWTGYIVWHHKTFFFFIGIAHWEPVNRQRLGSKVGSLIVVIGILLILTSFLSIWLGNTIATITGILALIDVIMIVIFIAADQMGY